MTSVENTIMQGMVAGKSRGKLRQSRTSQICSVATASRVAEDKHLFRKRNLGSDILKRRGFQTKKMGHLVRDR